MDHLKASGWEVMSASMTFMESEGSGGLDASSTNDLSAFDELENADDLHEALSIINSRSHSKDTLMVALCLRFQIESLDETSEISTAIYESQARLKNLEFFGNICNFFKFQLILHKFSISENSLVSSQILGKISGSHKMHI